MTGGREVWVGLCPHCHRPGLVLGAKPKQDAPAVLYCPECRKDCTLPEVEFARL